jgi:hypothetical protein
MSWRLFFLAGSSIIVVRPIVPLVSLRSMARKRSVGFVLLLREVGFELNYLCDSFRLSYMLRLISSPATRSPTVRLTHSLCLISKA